MWCLHETPGGLIRYNHAMSWSPGGESEPSPLESCWVGVVWHHRLYLYGFLAAVFGTWLSLKMAFSKVRETPHPHTCVWWDEADTHMSVVG